MRYLWIEDFDGGNSTKSVNEKKWREYFQLEECIIISNLQDALTFLDEKENWKKFDAVLIDIRFPVCNKTGGSSINEIYRKYFKAILEEKNIINIVE